MAVTSYDFITVEAENITADIIIWRRYRTRAPGMVERLMDDNPHLAKVHAHSPFIPIGTQVRIPIDPILLQGAPQQQATVQLYGKA